MLIVYKYKETIVVIIIYWTTFQRHLTRVKILIQIYIRHVYKWAIYVFLKTMYELMNNYKLLNYYY